MQTILLNRSGQAIPERSCYPITSVEVSGLESKRPHWLGDSSRHLAEVERIFNGSPKVQHRTRSFLPPILLHGAHFLNALSAWSPQRWANSRLTAGRLIVVGSCDIDGYRAPNSAYLGLANAIDLYSFGRGVLVPSEIKTSTNEYRPADGASAAAATVAGIITMLNRLGRSNGTDSAKDLLKSIATSRKGRNWPSQDGVLHRRLPSWEMRCRDEGFQFSQPIASHVAMPEPITVAKSRPRTFRRWTRHSGMSAFLAFSAYCSKLPRST